jgi:hypothetical protein
MKIACESPVSTLPVITEITDYDFVIASHCFKNAVYKDYYVSLRKDQPMREMFLDNGAFEEGKAVDTAFYKDLIYELHPTIVVLPDVVNNMQTTLDRVNNYINENSQLFKDFDNMGVLQGKSTEEYMQCLEFYNQFEEIGCIGIPYHLFYRPLFIEKNNIIEYCKKNNLLIHILGLPNPFELHELSKWDSVILSVDTSLPVVSGKNARVFAHNQWQRERVNIDDIYNSEQLSFACQNIEFLKNIKLK